MRRTSASLALLCVLALAACDGSSARRGDHPGTGATSGGAGPLVAKVGEGGTISKSSNKLATHTYGTELCSDLDAEITIDRVRYDTTPTLADTTEPAPQVPSIGTWFREVPPIEDGGYYPIISASGPAEHLPGDAQVIPEDGYPMVVEHGCDGYDDDATRTWPIVEMLTQISAGPEGGIATKTYIDYHVGSARYTLPVSWQLGVCGTDVPQRYGCRAKGR